MDSGDVLEVKMDMDDLIFKSMVNFSFEAIMNQTMFQLYLRECSKQEINSKKN